ncbi:MAG: NUDIX domain-containing protein [Alphaproteobacteria bacterium]|nr:NUDIX domain-containing protein [Alphaproteobacteria bacterium]
MENLDIYDEYMNKVGTESRQTVHERGLWHKTVHCWMYDDDGNAYFQERADSGKLYTTASGHVLAGETVRDAFRREIMEEIGVDTDASNAMPLQIGFWRQDKDEKNWHDRAFAHVYMNKLSIGFTDFHIQSDEVASVVRVPAKDCVDLLMGKIPEITAIRMTQNDTNLVIVNVANFLVAPDETAIIKYGHILQSIMQVTNK